MALFARKKRSVGEIMAPLTKMRDDLLDHISDLCVEKKELVAKLNDNSAERCTAEHCLSGLERILTG